MLSLGYARVLIGLLVHVRCCAQRLYILTTSKDSGGHESLAPLFWGSWAEKLGTPALAHRELESLECKTRTFITFSIGVLTYLLPGMISCINVPEEISKAASNHFTFTDAGTGMTAVEINVGHRRISCMI